MVVLCAWAIKDTLQEVWNNAKQLYFKVENNEVNVLYNLFR